MANPIAKLERAFRRDPDSPLFARLADLYLEKGDIGYAVGLCEKGCAAFPHYSTGFVVLSKCYEDQGDVERAREAMGNALRLDPENPGGYKRLSDLYQQLGVFPLALQSLEQAAYLDPFDDTLNERIDHLTYQSRKGSTEERPSLEVLPLSAREATPDAADTADAQIARQAQEDDTGDEPVEPFAQVQAVSEQSDSPDVSDGLKGFERASDPIHAEDGGTHITPTAHPDIGQFAESAAAAPPAPASPTASSDGRDDAVAAPGAEIFVGDSSESPRGTDAVAPPALEAPAPTPEPERPATTIVTPELATTESAPADEDEATEDAAAVARKVTDYLQGQATESGAAGKEASQVESWVRLSQQDKQLENAEQINKPFFFTTASETATQKHAAADKDADTSNYIAAETTENSDTSAPDPATEAPPNDAELFRLFHEIEHDAPVDQKRAEAEPDAKIVDADPIPEVPASTLASVSDEPKPPDVFIPNRPEEKRIGTVTLAEIYNSQGLKQRAIETYRELLTQDPNNTVLRNKLESLKKEKRQEIKRK